MMTERMSYYVIAGIFALIILLLFLLSVRKKKGIRKDGGLSDGGFENGNGNTPSETPRSGGTGKTDSGTDKAGSDHAKEATLHIPAELQDPPPDAPVPEDVDPVELQTGTDHTLFTNNDRVEGWVCPWCEAENDDRQKLCQVCGKDREE